MIKTEIILNGTYLDLIDDVSMPFTYQIADIKDPSKKNTNFSKTITLPGTATNNEIFGYIWDTNIAVTSSGSTNFSPYFNPNKKADVQIIYDGAEVFKGFMKLDKIKVLSDYKIEYDVTCFGKLKDLFLELGEKTMADLNLSKYNHPYTYDVQKASWNNYIYKNGVTTAFNKGDGYVYPMVDYALNNNYDWKTEHFFPAIYYKTLIDEIITQAGYKYDGSIFNDNDFKSLVVSYGSGELKLSTTQVANKTFQAGKTSDQTIDVSFGTLVGTGSNRSTNPTQISYQDDSTPPNNDAGNNYSTSLNTFTAPTNGTYNFYSSYNLSFTHFPLNAGSYTYPLRQVIIGNFAIRKNNAQVVTLPVQILLSSTAANSTAYNNGIYNIYLSNTITSGSTSATFSPNLNLTINLNAGDTIDVSFTRTKGIWGSYSVGGSYEYNIYSDDFFNIAPSNFPASYMRMNVKTNSTFKNTLASVGLSEGETVDMSSLFSNQIKQKDFISSFFKLFNIYTETDKFDPYLLHFEPRNNFFASSGTIRNWDEKLDYSQNYELMPMGDLDARTYLYKFKEDTDYWNDFYKKKYQEVYGQKRYTVDNDWVSNVNTTEVIFSPTPLVDRGGDDKILPRIIQMNSNGTPQPLTSNANKANNLRLWYFGGVKTTSGYNYIRTSGTTLETQYGYAGHIDNTSNPNYDVNFGIPIEVYYTATDYTNRNLFNIYYKDFIEQISSKDSKIFKGQFHVTPKDIAELNFRDTFYFHGDYWSLNKIYDFNPVELGKTTTCEFIKLKQGVPFSPVSKGINGGKLDTLGSDTSPTYGDTSPKDGNILYSDVVVSGSDNVVGDNVRDTVVIGSENRVGSGSQGISLINSSGVTVINGAKNVTLINTYDFTVDDSYNNSVIIDNQRSTTTDIIWSSGTYYLDGSEKNSFIIFEITTDETCYLPKTDRIYNGYTIEVKNANDSGWNLTVMIQYLNADEVVPIWSAGDGTSFGQHQLLAGDSYKYTYYNNVWYIR